MFTLRLRMFLLLTVMFAIMYAVATMIGTSMGINNFYFYLGLSLAMMFIQYMIGPKMVEMMMRVRYIEPGRHPELHRIVNDLAMRAKIPAPKIGVAEIALPNAFAFGRGLSDGRICVTQGILNLLNEDELRAVLGHEMSHLKNRDVLTITILSVIPMILYRIFWHLTFYGGRSRRESGGANTVLIGLAAFLFYFITNLLVLYASRIREYFADQGSVELGNRPASLASALYKLVYGAAKTDRDELRDVEGLKAFFVNDPSRALSEIKELRSLDVDKSGTIDPHEMDMLMNKRIVLGFGDKLMELLSTHPNMLKRIKHLSEYRV